MQAEREFLVKHTFPELRRWGAERGLVIQEIDLRWGIPQERSRRGEVISLCLDEIDRCRPFFIGFLGDRYGWVPDFIPGHVVRHHPWVRDYPEHSVTHLEILHGAFSEKAASSHALFYLRSVSEKEGPRPEGWERQKALREEVRKRFPETRPDFTSPRDLGDALLEDLKRVLEAEYAERESDDPLELWAQQQASWARRKCLNFVGRRAIQRVLDAHATADAPPLVITGPPGIGKSALLARWTLRWEEEGSQPILSHFVGAEGRGADPEELLRRLLHELRHRFPFPEPVPSDPSLRRRLLATWLERVPGLILVIDGLDHLDAGGGPADLGWLPANWPEQVRLVVSARQDSAAFEMLVARGWTVEALEEFTVEEREERITKQLAGAGKELSGSHLHRIVQSPATGLPLYAAILAEELRQYGVHETLEERLLFYLSALDPKELYDRILERCEEDFEVDQPGLVGRAMSLLVASRGGLTERDLIVLLGAGHHPLPPVYLLPLLAALDTSLQKIEGRLYIADPFLREAVEQRYLFSADLRRNLHRRLAWYFTTIYRPHPKWSLPVVRSETSLPTEKAGETVYRGEGPVELLLPLNNEFGGPPVDGRQIDEIPWHHERAEDWEALSDFVIAIPNFMRLREREPLGLARYWFSLKNLFAEIDFGARYESSYESWVAESDPEETTRALVLNELAHQLERANFPRAALPFARRAVEISETIQPDSADLAADLGNLAKALHGAGDPHEAVPLIVRSRRITESLGEADREGLFRILLVEAVICAAAGEREPALEAWSRAEALTEDGIGDPVEAWLVLAEIDAYSGGIEQEKALRQAVVIAERTLGRDHPRTVSAWQMLARFLADNARWDEAAPLYRLILESQQRLFGNSAAICGPTWQALGEAALLRGDLESADRHLHQALRILDREGPTDEVSLALALMKLGALEQMKAERSSEDGTRRGHRRQAERYLSRALDELPESLGDDHPTRIILLNNLGFARMHLGDFAGAEPLLRQSVLLDELRSDADPSILASTRFNLSYALWENGQWDESIAQLRRAIDEGAAAGAAETVDRRVLLAERLLLSGSVDEWWRELQQLPVETAVEIVHRRGEMLRQEGAFREAEEAEYRVIALLNRPGNAGSAEARQLSLGYLDWCRQGHRWGLGLELWKGSPFQDAEMADAAAPIAQGLLNSGACAEAIGLFCEFREIIEAAEGTESQNALSVRYLLGRALHIDNQLDEAEILLRESVARLDLPQAKEALRALLRERARREQLAEAIRELGGGKHDLPARARAFTECLVAKGNAESWPEELWNIARGQLPPGDHRLFPVLRNLCAETAKRGDSAGVERQLTLLLDGVWPRFFVVLCMRELSRIARTRREWSLAEKWLHRAVLHLEQKDNGDPSATVSLLRELAAIYRDTGFREPALASLKQARQLAEASQGQESEVFEEITREMEVIQRIARKNRLLPGSRRELPRPTGSGL